MYGVVLVLFPQRLLAIARAAITKPHSPRDRRRVLRGRLEAVIGALSGRALHGHAHLKISTYFLAQGQEGSGIQDVESETVKGGREQRRAIFCWLANKHGDRRAGTIRCFVARRLDEREKVFLEMAASFAGRTKKHEEHGACMDSVLRIYLLTLLTALKGCDAGPYMYTLHISLFAFRLCLLSFPSLSLSLNEWKEPLHPKLAPTAIAAAAFGSWSSLFSPLLFPFSVFARFSLLPLPPLLLLLSKSIPFPPIPPLYLPPSLFPAKKGTTTTAAAATAIVTTTFTQTCPIHPSIHPSCAVLPSSLFFLSLTRSAISRSFQPISLEKAKSSTSRLEGTYCLLALVERRSQ